MRSKTISLQSLFDQAGALKKRGELDQAIAIYRQAVENYPNSGTAEHNLAAALGDAGYASEAEAHIQDGFRKGLNAPQSWLVYARALQMQGKLDDARDAYAKTIELNPGILDAHRELAQLTWMMTGDSAAAIKELEATIESFPDVPALHSLKTLVLRFTAGARPAYDFVSTSLQHWPDDVSLLGLAINNATLAGEPEAALTLSDRLVALQPDSQSARNLRAIALLAAGDAGAALPIVETMVAASPEDQHALAMLATTCRLLGDTRHAELYNYEEFVRPYDLVAPPGWSSLDKYLADLGTELRERHPYKMHPFSNSLDGGSMIMGIFGTDDPAISALPQAIGPAIDKHLEYLGSGDDPLRSRNSTCWKIDGIWSVLLRPNGFHHDHVHPNGWLSSACYIELPDAVGDDKAGWIKFGEPGIVTTPGLLYEHAVRPHPGTIVLFPSYMWHGTIPFDGDEPRLTVALDIVPG